jgi:hypothetical protein
MIEGQPADQWSRPTDFDKPRRNFHKAGSCWKIKDEFHQRWAVDLLAPLGGGSVASGRGAASGQDNPAQESLRFANHPESSSFAISGRTAESDRSGTRN